MESEKFDLVLVTERFKNALNEEDDVMMDFYLLAFREILKFVFFVFIYEYFKAHNLLIGFST